MMSLMTSPQNLTPGTIVRFTSYGRKGTTEGTLNGYTYEGSGYGLMGHVRLANGNVVSVSAARITAA